MIKLRENDIKKLSYLTKISEHDLNTLSSLGLLDDINVIDMLIYNDYQHIKRKKVVPAKALIIQSLAAEYDLSASRIENAMYKKKKKVYFCSVCGKTMPQSKYKKNNKVCNKCLSKNIKILSYESSDGGV